MTINTIRHKLYDYIRVADDKKIKAIYTMLEDEITHEVEWWKNNVFTNELDQRYAKWQSGKVAAFTLTQMDKTFEQLKKKRKTK
jgi:hypothetical protein